jgi:1-acyl-sn-glycerol-3-phosphate acyltransferase
MSPWLARRWYDTVFHGTFWGFTFGNSLRVRGRRNMPATGPVLLVSNHQSYLDPVLVGLASRRYLTFLARETLFRNRFFRGLIESLDAIPIDNKGLGKDGLVLTLSRLQAGKCVLIFPEGERTSDGGILPLKPGITLLLGKLACPIVPVGITGAFGAWSRDAKVPKLSPLFLPANNAAIAVSIGPPIDPATLNHLPRAEQLERLHAAITTEFQNAKAIQRKA